MRFWIARARAAAVVPVLGLAAALTALPASPAAAATCPSVDPSTHAVSPVPSYGVDWSGCALSGADLTTGSLSHATLTGADLSNATLTGADLDTADLTSANLSNATLTGTDLDWANLTGATLTGADLRGAYLNLAYLTNSDLGQADLTGASLTALTTGGITGTPSALPAGYSVDDAYLIGPNLIINGVSLSGQDLSGINLSGSALKNADLSSASLTGANLSGDDFTNASLAGADLTGASLSGTTLAGTDLSGTTLDGVSSGSITGTPQNLPAHWWLSGDGYLAGPKADLAGAHLNNDAHFNLDLAGANLSGAELISASFPYANLAGADLSHADLSSTNLSDADLTGADLTSAALDSTNLTATTLAGAIFTSASMSGVSSGSITGTPQTALPANWALVGGALIGPRAWVSGGSFAHADLSGLDFYYAHVTDSDLSYANLTGADTTGAQFSADTWLDTTCPDGTNSNADVAGCFSAKDTVPPTAHPAVTAGTLGTNGWYTSPVTVSWNWTDNGAVDPANCTTSTDRTLEGKNIYLTRSCTDLAGNQGSATFHLQLDKTAPVVAVTGVAPGHTYLYGKVPAAGCTTTDALSGVATAAAVTVTTTGSNGVGAFTATCAGGADQAGNQAAPVSVSYRVLYGFGGFTSPKPGSTIARSAGKISVKFRLTNAAGTPIPASRASALAAAGKVRAKLSGPGISAVSALCAWNATAKLFQCTVKIPSGVRTGSTVSYPVTAAEDVGTGFTKAPATGTAANPEKIHFK